MNSRASRADGACLLPESWGSAPVYLRAAWPESVLVFLPVTNNEISLLILFITGFWRAHWMTSAWPLGYVYMRMHDSKHEADETGLWNGPGIAIAPGVHPIFNFYYLAKPGYRGGCNPSQS